ncbi:MAG: NAD(P)H-hydrate dehydratase [Lentimicrobium sp.]|nr:NAD(P)H-hydrate dehydratase [Lentimicrobium sp.]
MCALKILPVEKIREADAYTIAHEPIASIELMERAALACFRWMIKNAPKEKLIRVICGVGNNGGDGLAIARLLYNEGYDVEVLVIRHADQASPDFTENFRQLGEIPELVITDIFESDPALDLTADDLIIDAILGSGLNRQATGFIAGIIEQINQSHALVISIDIPSGLFADLPAELNRQAIVRADYTLTFQTPKLAFMMAENELYTGRVHVLDIGLHATFMETCECNHLLIEKEDCRNLYRPRTLFSHKGHYGHALLIAGSTGKMGAAMLAARACLRSGVGLLTAHIPGDGFLIMQNSVHEAMVSIDPEDFCFSQMPDIAPYQAIGIGPGLGMESQTQAAFKLLIQQTHVPLVIDADALNILGENKTWISFLPAGSILTPHPKEFERIAGATANHFDRLELLRLMAMRFKLYIILKGARTAIAAPDGTIYFNPTGNPGMATGGSGDVLTGIILGLLTSGYPARDACILGTWLHGKAGDMAARKFGQEAMLPGDIIQYLGKAFKKLY